MVSKRRYTVLAAALSLAVCCAMSGCGSDAAEKVELDGSCSFDAQITKGQQSFEVSFQREDDGSWTAVFTSPDSLSDMTVKSFGESCEVYHQGLILELTADKLPSGSVVEAIESCIDHAAKSSSAEFVNEDDVTLVRGEAGCGMYELRVAENGELISLDIGSEFCAGFSGFEKLS